MIEARAICITHAHNRQVCLFIFVYRVFLKDVKLNFEKSDSANDRSEGYLYYTCSQSSNLSIYICIPGVSQRCQVKF